MSIFFFILKVLILEYGLHITRESNQFFQINAMKYIRSFMVSHLKCMIKVWFKGVHSIDT